MNYLIHGINCCTLRDFNRYSLGRDPKCLDGKVRLQTEILAYTGQQLIPDPTTLDIGGMMHPRGINAICWILDQ